MSLLEPHRFKKLEKAHKELLKQSIYPLMEKYQMGSEIVLKELLQISGIFIIFQFNTLDPQQETFTDAYIFLRFKNLESVFPELTTIYHIVSTIPSSSAV